MTTGIQQERQVGDKGKAADIEWERQVDDNRKVVGRDHTVMTGYWKVQRIAVDCQICHKVETMIYCYPHHLKHRVFSSEKSVCVSEWDFHLP